MVNQRQLNGGKQGPGSGLDADTVDGTQGSNLSSELGKKVSLNEYRTFTNDSASERGELAFEVGLAQKNYPDGLFDVFVDESKVSSSSKVDKNTGTNGNIQLSSTTNTLDTPNQDFNNSRSTSDGGPGMVIDPNSPITDLTVDFMSGSGSSIEEVIIQNSDGSSNLYTQSISVSDGGSVTFNNISLNANTEYRVIVNTSQTYDSTGSNTSPPKSGTNLDVVADIGRTGSRNTSNHRMFTSYTSTSQETNGSLTSTTQDKGYSATKVTLTADYSLNGQNIDSIKLFDGADTELASFNESEIGDTKTVSTSRTDYYVEINLSGDGTDTPKVNNYEVGLDD